MSALTNSAASAAVPAAHVVAAVSPDSATQAARRWLTLGVAALAVGLGVRALRGQGPIADYLFLYTSASEQFALNVEYAGGCVLLLIAPMLAFRKLWALSGCIILWVLMSAWAWRTDASTYGDLVWGAHGIRYAAPMAFMLLCASPWLMNQAITSRYVINVLRVGLAATFAFHGLEAILLLPEFLDYAQSAVSILGVQIHDRTAAILLRIIGCWDLTLAALVLFSRWRWPLIAMAMWGTATAVLRLFDGWSYYPETVLRLIHVCPAVAVLLLNRSLNVSVPTASAPTAPTKDVPHAIPLSS